MKPYIIGAIVWLAFGCITTWFNLRDSEPEPNAQQLAILNSMQYPLKGIDHE